jgi:hypothetical protein
MKLFIEYEEESYQVDWVQGAESLTFDSILAHRPLLYCWMEDEPTSVWIRIPRIEILRLLLTCSTEAFIRLRFQLSESLDPHCFRSNDASGGASYEEASAACVIPLDDGSVKSLSVGEAGAAGRVTIKEPGDLSELCITLNADVLLKKIRAEAEKSVSPFEIMVSGEASVGGELDYSRCCQIQLRRQIWVSCLLKGHTSSDMFVNYVTEGFENLFGLEAKLKELHCHKDLWMRINCFHYDLKRFDSAAQARLENYGGEFYMNSRYFTAEEMDYLLSFPTASGATARQCLQFLFTAKGDIREVCTSHDMAPAIEKIFGIRKGFEHDKGFKEYFKKFSSKKGTF